MKINELQFLENSWNRNEIPPLKYSIVHHYLENISEGGGAPNLTCISLP